MEPDLALALGFVSGLKLLEGVFGVDLQQVQLSCLGLDLLLQALLLGAGGTHTPSHGHVFGLGASLFTWGPPRAQRQGHLGFGVRRLETGGTRERGSATAQVLLEDILQRHTHPKPMLWLRQLQMQNTSFSNIEGQCLARFNPLYVNDKVSPPGRRRNPRTTLVSHPLGAFSQHFTICPCHNTPK